MISQKNETFDPPSNTGSNCQPGTLNPLPTAISGYSTGMDWLQGLLWFDTFDQLESLANRLAAAVSDFLAWSEDTPWFCGQKWGHCVRSVRGLCFAWNVYEDREINKFRLFIVLPGGFWSRLDDVTDAWAVCSLLKDLGFRATRSDWRIDDYEKRLTYGRLLNAIQQGNYFGFKLADPRRLYDDGDCSNTGFTVYFGSPGSDKRLRIYDKNVESKGKIDSIRIEVQYRDTRADCAFERFVSMCNINDFIQTPHTEIEELLSQFVASVVTGSIIFAHRDSDERLDRRTLLSFWRDFLEMVSHGQRIPSSRPEPTISTTISWCFRQVSKSLKILKDGFDTTFYQFWTDLMDCAAEKFTERDAHKILVLRNDMHGYKRGVYYSPQAGFV